MILFTEEQKKRVAEEVAKAEQGTAGELVVVHAACSHDYAAYRAGLAFVLSLGAAHAGHIFLPEVELVYLFIGQLVVGLLSYLLLGVGPLLRMLVSGETRAEKSMHGAMRAFTEQGVTETRDRSGVLIYLSELEHQVVILADKGINERVDATEWQADVDTLVVALRSGDATGGLVSVIGRIGGILSAAFPPREDDTNELSDSIRQV